MKSRLLIILCLSAASAHAQAGIASAGAVETIGAPLGTEALGANTLLIGSETSVSYDNNAFNSKPQTQDFITAIYPHVSLNVVRPRWGATLTYIPGFSYSSANIPAYNVFSQSLGATYSYSVTERLSLDLRNTYSSSSNPFDALRNASVLPQFGVLNTPTAVSWNLLPKTIEAAEADASYKFTPRVSGYVRAGYEYLGYQQYVGANGNVQASQQSNSGVISVGLSRQFSSRTTMGLQLNSQVLDFARGEVRTTAQTLAYVFQTSVGRGIAISAITGPQYLDTRVASLSGGATVANSLTQSVATWSWMGGGTIGWTGVNSGLSASVIRQLSTGTGLQGNVRQTIAGLQAQRKLGKSTSLSLFATYNMNDPLVAGRLGLATSNSYLSAGGALNREIGHHLTIGCTVWAVREGGGSSANPYYSDNHNRAAFSLSYQLTKPVKRS